MENKLYAAGAEWKSADNCTTFACNIQDGQTFVSSMMATCPDVSKCAPTMRYNDGCCEKCKMEPLSQHNCLPESLAESVTIGLIRTQIPSHGNCKNVNSVRGITQCSGSCQSGTRFDPCKLVQMRVFQLNFMYIPNVSFYASWTFSDIASTQRLWLLLGERSERNSSWTHMRWQIQVNKTFQRTVILLMF